MQDSSAGAMDIVALAVDECREYLRRGTMPSVLIDDSIAALVFQFEAMRTLDLIAAAAAEAEFRRRLGEK